MKWPSWIVVSLLATSLSAAEPAKSAKKTAPALPAGVKVLRDLEFARPDDHALRLDLYLPEAPADRPLPVVVWVHGGGWSGGGKDRCPAAFLAADGFAVASISYRLTDVAQWPAQIDDCRAAIRWLRRNAEREGLDAEHIGVWGGSAGGHLVALLGTLDSPDAPTEPSCKVQAVCDWYGPTDLLTMPPNVLSAGKTEADLAKSNGAKLLGGTVRDRPEMAKQASALYQVSADDVPFLIMHGDRDPAVPLEQSTRLHDALRAAGVESTLVVLEGAGHGGAAFQTEAAQKTIRQFFARHLRR